jgi:hypothetical protein
LRYSAAGSAAGRSGAGALAPPLRRRPAGANGRKPKAPKPEDLRAAPQFKLPITGGRGKAKDEQASAEAPKSKSRRKSA